MSPSKILNWLKDVTKSVTDRFNGEEPIRNGQAITVRIKSKDLDIDLVPAGIFKNKTGNVFYNIPAANKDNGWTLTDPKSDIQLLADIAEGKNDFRKVIRLMKYIRSSYKMTVSSFAIESAVIQYGQMYIWNNDLFLDVQGVLSYLSEKFSAGKISDPYDSNVNLIDGVESLEWYSERIQTILGTLRILNDVYDQQRVQEKVNKVFSNN